MGLGTSVYKAVKKVEGRCFCFFLIIFLFVPLQLSSQKKLFLGRKNIGRAVGRPCTSQGTSMGRTIPDDKPDIIICNNERGKWPLLGIAIL
jgi:hypothetical protein